MTLKELQRQYLDATEHTWHQHPNGGGWVQNTATVDDTACVGSRAIVAGHVRVDEHARIEERARVTENAVVTNNAVVTDDAMVTGNAVVSERAMVYGYATVGMNARIEQCARVGRHSVVSGNAIITERAVVTEVVTIVDGTWPVSPLYIRGSRCPIYLVSPVLLRIGCETNTIDEWLGGVGEEAAHREKFSDAEIAEYRAYIELARDWTKRVFG